MKEKLYRISNIALWVLLVSNLFVFLAFTGIKQNELTCKEYKIEIDNAESGLYFLDQEQVVNIICNHLNVQSLIGTPLLDLNPHVLEKLLQSNPYVKQAKVYKEISGLLVVQIIQKRPIARVFTNQYDYYIDENGGKFEYNEHFTARVPIVYGFIFEGTQIKDSMVTTQGKMVSHLMNCVDTNIFCKSLTESIYINEENELIIIPKIGPDEIILGDDQELSEKLNKLKVFYYKVLNTVGYNRYKSINLKYKSQVVCK